MIPLPDDMRAKMAKQAQSLKSMTGKELQDRTWATQGRVTNQAR